MLRCARPDCIAPCAQELVDGPDSYLFCADCFSSFEARLERIRAERDRLVTAGVDIQMANRIIGERVERREI